MLLKNYTAVRTLAKWIMALIGALMLMTLTTGAASNDLPSISPAMSMSGDVYSGELCVSSGGGEKMIPLGITCISFAGTQTAQEDSGSEIVFHFKNVELRDLTIQ